jgi:dihydrofolate reductase
MKKFNVILATDLSGGFGLDGELPWDLEKDYGFFKTITRTHSILPGINRANNILIAGRKTWESMGRKPLPERITFVVTSQWEELEKTHGSSQIQFFPSFFSAYQKAQTHTQSDIWVIGGKGIYDAALRHWACDQVYWTQI